MAKSDSCLLPASLCKSPGGAPSLPKAFQQTQLPSLSCWPSLPDAYEDWLSRSRGTFERARELRQVLGLLSVPDFTTLYRFLQRLTTRPLTRGWRNGASVAWLVATKREEGPVAVDATGLAQAR